MSLPYKSYYCNQSGEHYKLFIYNNVAFVKYSKNHSITGNKNFLKLIEDKKVIGYWFYGWGKNHGMRVVSRNPFSKDEDDDPFTAQDYKAKIRIIKFNNNFEDKLNV